MRRRGCHMHSVYVGIPYSTDGWSHECIRYDVFVCLYVLPNPACGGGLHPRHAYEGICRRHAVLLLALLSYCTVPSHTAGVCRCSGGCVCAVRVQWLHMRTDEKAMVPAYEAVCSCMDTVHVRACTVCAFMTYSIVIPTVQNVRSHSRPFCGYRRQGCDRTL